MEVRGQLHAPAALPPGEEPPGTQLIEGWVGPRAILDAVVKRKIPSSRRKSDTGTPRKINLRTVSTDSGVPLVMHIDSHSAEVCRYLSCLSVCLHEISPRYETWSFQCGAPLLVRHSGPDRIWGPPSLVSNGYCGLFLRGVKLTAHFYPAPRVRIRGAIPPLPDTPSWRCHLFSTGTTCIGNCVMSSYV